LVLVTSYQQQYQLTLCEFLRCKKLRRKWIDCLQWFMFIYFKKRKLLYSFFRQCVINTCNSSIICMNPSKPPELTLKSLYIFLYIVCWCVPMTLQLIEDFSQTLNSVCWLVFLMETHCVLCEVPTSHTQTHTLTHTHTTNTSTYICTYCRRVSVFRRLRDESQNCSKSRSLSRKFIRRRILTIICFCSELYNCRYNCTIVRTTDQLFRRLVISQKGGERASEGGRSGSE
jgi:hypothetical protein